MLYLVWHDESPGNKEIYFRKSTNYGTNWINLKRLTWNTGWSNYPKLGIDSKGDINVVYEDRTPGDQEIFYKRITDGGSTWTMPYRITWNSGCSWHPFVITDSNNTLHLVWADNTSGNFKIYYKNYCLLIQQGGMTKTL